MNLHPLVVHFPIALWMIYCAILLIQTLWWASNDKLNTIKQFCIIISFVAAIAAAMSGDWATQFHPRTNLIQSHEMRAGITQNFFAVFSIITVYTLQTRTTKFPQDITVRSILLSVINHKWLMGFIWLVLVILVTIVGALGWAIVRGTGNGDPISDLAVKTLVGDIITQPLGSQDNIVANFSKTTGDTTAEVTITPPITEYTIAQVAIHNNEASCRSVINGAVYDLSTFISKHPWWDRNIIRICGIDGSIAFNWKHGWQSGPEQTLAEFKIGILTN